MAFASELLSSPCGYYGELILQDLRSPIAAAVMATEQMIAPKERINEFRSHFNGLRILEQEAGWCCEARITLPKLEATTHAWLPFAELRGAEAAERSTSQGAVLIPQYSEPERTPEFKASFARCQEAEKKKVASSKLLTSAIRGLFPWIMPNLIPSQGELHFGLNSSGPNRAMSEWLSKNDKHLAQLWAADVDGLLKDLAAHLASAYSTIWSRGRRKTTFLWNFLGGLCGRIQVHRPRISSSLVSWP